MSSISPYDEALQIIKQNPGTGGAGSMAKLVLSLYNDMCGYSFAECVGNMDQRLIGVALRMVKDYAEHGETEDLRAAGKVISDDLYPRLWEMGIAMRDARSALRSKWQDDERANEAAELEAAEAALFTDPAKRIPISHAKELLDRDDPLSGYFNSRGDWRSRELSREMVHAAIESTGGSEMSHNCPESGNMLAVRIEQRIYYLFTDYDARESYLARERS